MSRPASVLLSLHSALLVSVLVFGILTVTTLVLYLGLFGTDQAQLEQHGEALFVIGAGCGTCLGSLIAGCAAFSLTKPRQ